MGVRPIDAARDVLDRADNLLSLDTAMHDEVLRQEIRRMAWTMGSTALDTYFHWRVRNVALKAPLPRKLREFRIPFGDLFDSGEATVAARKRGILDRPQTRARNALYRAILNETYSSPTGVEKAVGMFGGKNLWSAVSGPLELKPTEVKERVGRISTRRNHIVHEGDVKRQQRPRVLQHQTLGEEEVCGELQWIRKFLETVDAEI